MWQISRSSFWQLEYERYSPRYRADTIAPILNKVGAFLADPKLNNILNRPDGQIRLRTMMDQGKVLLVNLARGKIGEDSAAMHDNSVGQAPPTKSVVVARYPWV